MQIRFPREHIHPFPYRPEDHSGEDWRIRGKLHPAGAAGGGLIGAGLDAHSSGGISKKTTEYYSMNPGQMLGKDKENFMIHYASVQSVEMKQPRFIGQGEVKFKTSGKDKRFMLDTSKEIFSTYMAPCNRHSPAGS